MAKTNLSDEIKKMMGEINDMKNAVVKENPNIDINIKGKADKESVKDAAKELQNEANNNPATLPIDVDSKQLNKSLKDAFDKVDTPKIKIGIDKKFLNDSVKDAFSNIKIDLDKPIESFKDLQAVMSEFKATYDKIQKGTIKRQDPKYIGINTGFGDIIPKDDYRDTVNWDLPSEEGLLDKQKAKLLEIFKLYKNIQSAVKNNKGFYKGEQYDTRDLEDLEHVFKSYAQAYYEMSLEIQEADERLNAEGLRGDLSKDIESLESVTSKMTRQFKGYVQEVIKDSDAVKANNKAYEQEQLQLRASNNLLEQRSELLRNKILDEVKARRGQEAYEKAYDALPFLYSDYDMYDEWGKKGFFSDKTIDVLEEVAQAFGFEIPQAIEKTDEELKEVIQPDTSKLEKVLETLQKMKAYIDAVESDEHADLYGFQDLKGVDFNKVFNALKSFDFDLLKQIGFGDEDIERVRNKFSKIIADIKDTQALGRKVKNQDAWNAYESEHGQPPEVRVIDLFDEWSSVVDKLIAKIHTLGETEKEVSTISPTQEFDNDVQRNVVFLENYKNTIKEIDKLKLEPETEETRRKLEELNNLAEYFVSNISAIRSENGHTVSPEMMQFGGTWAPNLMYRYSSNQLRDMLQIAHDNAGKATNKPVSEYKYIKEELKAIEAQSESTRQSLTQDLIDSKKYAQKLADELQELVGAREELANSRLNAKDRETFSKEVVDIPKQYPEIAEISKQFKTWDDALKFTASDEWKDFLATLPQAHKYLESIGYDFDRLNKEEETTASDAVKQDVKLLSGVVDLKDMKDEEFKRVLLQWIAQDEEIYKVVDKMNQRTLELTSDKGISGKVTSYGSKGSYVQLEGTRSSANFFIDENGKRIRKPRNLGEGITRDLPFGVNAISGWDTDEARKEFLKLQQTAEETSEEVAKYVKKTDDEIYEAARKLAQNEEGIFEEIAQKEIALANKTSDETRKKYADMATATYKMFKEGAYESEIEDKIRSTDSLIKELQGRLETEADPEVILSLNEQLDEAKIKILALEEVFKDINKRLGRDIFSTSDFEDRDVLEKYSRRRRENYTVGQSNYSIATEDREYWQTLTKGISTEEELADAIAKRREEMIQLSMEEEKARQEEIALRETKDALPYGKERDEATAAYNKAFNQTESLVEKYNEVAESIYNLTQLQKGWGKSIDEASEINQIFMYSEWREEEQALNPIKDEIDEIAKARLRDAEAAEQEAKAGSKSLLRLEDLDRDKLIKWIQDLKKATLEYDEFQAKIANDESYDEAAWGKAEKKYKEFFDVLKQYKTITVSTKDNMYSLIGDLDAEDWDTAKSHIKTVTFERKEESNATEEEARAHRENAEAIDKENETRRESSSTLPPTPPKELPKTSESEDSLHEEEKAFEDTAEAASDAAKAKEDFNEANAETANQADKSGDKLKEEAKDARDVADAFKEAGKAFDGYYKNQTGYVGDDTWGYTKRTGFAQDILTSISHDKNGNMLVSETVKTDYKKLTNEILKTDKAIVQLDSAIQDMNRHGIDTTPSETNLKNLQRYLSALEDELRKYYDNPEYVPNDYQKQKFQSIRDEKRVYEENSVLQQRLVALKKEEQQAARDAVKQDKEATAQLEYREQIEEQIINTKKQQRQAQKDSDASKEATALAAQEKAYGNILKIKGQIVTVQNKSGDHTKELDNLQAQLRGQQKLYAQATLQLKATNNQYDAQARLEEIRESSVASAQKLAAAEDARANAAQKAVSNADAQAVKQSNSLYDKIVSNLNEIYDLKKKNVKLDNESVEDQVELADNTKKINSLYSEVSDTIKEINAAGAQQVSREEEILKLRRQLNGELTVAIQKQAGSEVDDLVVGVDKYLGKIKQINDGKYTQGFKDSFKGYNLDLEEIQRNLSRIKDDGVTALDPSEVKALSLAFDELKKNIEGALGGKGLSKNKEAAQSSLAKLRKSIEDIEARNTAMGSKFRAQFDNLKLKIDTAESNEAVEKLKAEIVELEAELIKSGKTGKSAFQQLRDAISTANTQFLTQYFSWQDWIRYGQQAFNTIKELDYALVDLKKTTTMTDSELDGFYYSANDTAKQMGVTTKEIIDQASAWSRLGYSSKDAATEMATLSSQFAQISPGMDVETATDGLVSVMKAFHVDVSDVERDIMDVINKTGNTMATNNEEIVDMLERSSAAMSAANNTIEETIALESAAVQITRNAETTGTAFRTISMRIRGYDEETEEYIGGIEELTGKIADLTKTAKTPGGLSLFTDETKTTYKSTYQILKEISDIYNDLSDKNQAELLETLAGKRGGQVLAGILEDFSEVERAMNNMSEAAGSADAEMGIVEESIQYKLNNLQQTWVGIIQKLIDNGMLGQLIDALTAISEVLGEIITSVGPIPTILGAIGLTKLIPNLDSVFDVIQRLSGESSNIVDVVSDAPDVIGDVGEAVEEVIGTVETVQGVAEGIPGTIASIQGALTALMANPLTPWIVGITVAVGAVALAIDHSTITVKEATKALKDYGDKYAKTESDLKAHEDAVKNLSDSYFKLAKGVDALTGKNVSLSSDDYEEFVATNQELAEMFPTLIKGVDQYGNYILDLGNDADSSRQKLKELLEQEKENYNYELYKDLPDVFKNTKVLIDDAATSLHNAEDDLAEYNRLLSQLDSASVFNDNPFVLSTKFTNENTAELIRQFELNYQKMIDEVAKENEDLAFRLRDALQDDSDGENYAKYLNFTQFTDEERQLIDSYFDKYVISVTKGYGDSVHELNVDLKTYQSQISSAWNGIKKNIIGGIDFLSDDDKVTESLTAFVNSLPSEFAEGLSQVDIQNYIADWVSDFENLDDASKLKFTKLFDPELTPEERIQLYNDLQTNLPDGFDIPIHLVVESDQDLLNRVNVSKARLSHNFEDKAIINNFFEEMSIDTAEEYNLWLEVTKGIDDATEAMEAYRKAKEAAVAVKEKGAFDNTAFSEQINGLDALQTAYNNFRTNVDNKEAKINLDISDVEALRETFGNLENFDFNQFEMVLTSDVSSVADIQKAFDEALTAYARQKVELEGINDQNKDMIRTQLEMEGATHESAEAFVDLQLEIQGVQDAAEKINFAKGVKEYSDALEEEIQKLQDWEIVDSEEEASKFAEQVLSGKAQSKFGNIDMDKRTIIRYNQEILETFKEGMSSWGTEFDEEGNVIRSYYDDIAEAVKEGSKAIDTVWGSSESFMIGQEEVEVAFTPIMVDENGNNPQFLSKGTVKNYIQNLLEKADEEITKSGEQWSQEAVIEKAIKLDLAGSWSDEYDAEGRVVGKQFVHGLIGAIGEEAIDIGSILHFSGEEGALKINSKLLEAYNSLKEKVAQGTLDVTNLTAEEIQVLELEGSVSEETAQKLALIALQNQLISGQPITTSAQVQSLYNLGAQAGLTAAELSVLNEIMRQLDMADSVANYDTGAAEKIRSYAQGKIDNFNKLVQDKFNELSQINFAPPAVKNAAGGGGKEAGDAWVEAYEKELKQLENDRDMGLISERVYLEKLKALIDKFFKDRAQYAEKYMEEMKKYMDALLSHYNSVISGVTTLLSRRITSLQNEKDAAITALQEEQTAAEEAYQSEIDGIQEEIDAIQEKIDALDDEIEKIDEKIEKLDEENEQIDEQIEGYEEQSKALDKQREGIEELIEGLDKETEALDEIIKKKQKEQKVIQDQIDAINEANAARDRSINLQKAEYELQRMQNQRTKLVYTGNPGQMRYEADQAGIRDAQNNLQDAKDEMRIAALQKEVDLIQKAIDGIEEQKEKIDEEKKSYDLMIESIEKQQKLLNNQIESLQEQQKAIQKQQKEYQKQQKELQKQQEAYQKQQEVLQKRQEEIRKEMESVTKNYQKMIDEQTKMFDDLIKKLEETKSKWEELAEVEAVAKAWGLVADEMARLGFTVDDVLNDVPGAFDAFKNEYVNAIAKMHEGDKNFLLGLQQISSQTPSTFQQASIAVDGTKTSIENLGTVAKTTEGLIQTLGTNADTAGAHVMQLGTTAGETKTNLQGMNDVQFGELVTTMQGVAENLQTISGVQLGDVMEALNAMKESVEPDKYEKMAQAFLILQGVALTTLSSDLEKMKASTDEATVTNIDSMKTAFTEMGGTSISQLVTDFTTLQGLLPTITEALVGAEADAGIIGALKEMQEITLEDGIISQFDALQESIVGVTNALDGSGGEGSGEKAEGDKKKESGADAEGGNMASALEHVKEVADTAIGSDAEEEADTVIGHFNALGTSIETVTKEKIGTADEDTEGTLKKAIEDTKDLVDEKVGTSADDTGDTVIGDFNELGDAVEKVAKEKVGLGAEGENSTLSGSFKKLHETSDEHIPEVTKAFEDLKDAIDDCVQKVSDLIDKINELPDGFSLDAFTFTGTANKLFTGTTNAHYKGTANYRGNWGVKKDETSLVGELGPELVVSQNGRYRTVGDDGPELTKLHRGDIVFNHKQTEEILSKKNRVTGPAHADGTLPEGFFRLKDDSKFDKLKEIIKDATLPIIDGVKNIVQDHTNAIRSEVKNISNNTSSNTTVNQHNTFNITGVSGEDVARQINTTLVNTFSGMSLNAYQRSMA